MVSEGERERERERGDEQAMRVRNETSEEDDEREYSHYKLSRRYNTLKPPNSSFNPLPSIVRFIPPKARGPTNCPFISPSQ